MYQILKNEKMIDLIQLSHRILKRTFRSLSSMEIFRSNIKEEKENLFSKNFSIHPSLIFVNKHSTELLFIMQDLVKDIQRYPLVLTQIEQLRLHSGETFAHSVNVALLMLMFSQKMQINTQDTTMLVLSGFLHDLGKRSIALDILRAPRQLTDIEWEKMRLHPVHGQNFLRKYKSLPQDLILGISDHHEHMDGKGYPAHKKGVAISEVGKIIALADVYEAISGTRPYKQRLSQKDTLRIMKKSEGHFDQTLFKKFEDCIEDNKNNQEEIKNELTKKRFFI